MLKYKGVVTLIKFVDKNNPEKNSIIAVLQIVHVVSPKLHQIVLDLKFTQQQYRGLFLLTNLENLAEKFMFQVLLHLLF